MDKKMTMEARIEAFYRQSGGPHNPRIDKLLQKHLLYGKDHGMPGYRETFADALMDVVLQDPSLLLLFERIQRSRVARSDHSKWEALEQRLERRFQKIEAELQAIQARLDELAGRMESGSMPKIDSLDR
ncbi:MAG TPA: hypothetical protein GX517_07255 [Alicyclobacillus sp.]|nr:hypothetical protein [Alicyclobacillus sp.]